MPRKKRMTISKIRRMTYWAGKMLGNLHAGINALKAFKEGDYEKAIEFIAKRGFRIVCWRTIYKGIRRLDKKLGTKLFHYNPGFMFEPYQASTGKLEKILEECYIF